MVSVYQCKSVQIILAVTVLLLLSMIAVAPVSSTLEDYGYYQECTLYNNGSTLSYYEINFTVYTGNGTSSGTTIYLNDHAQADLDDLRFTDSSDNIYDYWIQSDVSDPYGVWIEFISIPTGSSTLRIQYGNANATAMSSASSTFIQYHGSATSNFHDTNIISGAVVYEAKAKATADSSDLYWGLSNVATDPDVNSPTYPDTIAFKSCDSGGTNQRQAISRRGGTGGAIVIEEPAFTSGTWYRIKGVYSESSWRVSIDVPPMGIDTSWLPNETMGLIQYAESGSAEQAWSFLRTYAAIEPSIASWNDDGGETDVENQTPGYDNPLYYYTPHNVRFKFIDGYGVPITGLTCTATPTGGATVPWSWLCLVLGISSNVSMSTTKLVGMTGVDGEVNFLMVEVAEYNINCVKEGINETFGIIPKDTDYTIMLRGAGSPIDVSYSMPTANLTASEGESDVTFYLTYDDPDAATSSVFFIVKDGAGNVINNESVSLIDGYGIADYTTNATKTENFTVGYIATHPVAGTLQEWEPYMFKGTGALIPITLGLDEDTRQLMAIAIIFVIAGIFGSGTAKMGYFIVPFIGGGAFWTIGWLPSYMGGSICALSFLGALFYIMNRDREMVHGL